MTPMTPDALLTYLKKNNYKADLQDETKQVYTVLSASGKEYPLFLRIFDGGHLLQLLIFLPCGLNPDILPDMARLLHLLNKELDLPGFGMDELSGAIFYRLMIPTPKKKLEDEVLQAFLKTLEHVCNMFSPPIEAVANGALTLQEILKKATNPKSAP